MNGSGASVGRVEGLTKTWADGAGLRPVSFTLAAHELLVVRGPSGSGKSTLLALLAGWVEPDGGTIDRVEPWASSHRSWRGTAILPQVLAPIGELTTAENIALPLRLDGESWSTARARAAEMVESLDLASEAGRPATDVSMGQQQRMALGRAAAIRPIVLLADEPTSHQDADHAEAVLRVVRRLVDGGTCAVVASHDPAVAAVADRILDLDRSYTAT